MSHHQSSLGPGHTTPAHAVRDDDEEDLNKAFEVQGFHQILSPPANCPPDSHRVYDEQDFEDHRLFSPHVHQPLSRPPTDGRRKRVNEGRKDGRRGQTPAATTEEDQEAKDESCSDEEGGRAAGSRNPPNIPTNHSSRPVCHVGDIDEAETLNSVDLDGIKSHRFDDVPAVRRHLVRRSSKGPLVHGTNQPDGQTEVPLRHLRADRTPHEVSGRDLSYIQSDPFYSY